MKANFYDIHSAADYIGPGAVEVPLYQTEITDIRPAEQPVCAAHQAGSGHGSPVAGPGRQKRRLP